MENLFVNIFRRLSIFRIYSYRRMSYLLPLTVFPRFDIDSFITVNYTRTKIYMCNYKLYLMISTTFIHKTIYWLLIKLKYLFSYKRIYKLLLSQEIESRECPKIKRPYKFNNVSNKLQKFKNFGLSNNRLRARWM